MLRRAEEKPIAPIGSTLLEEEIACDTWAREYMISGLAAFSREHGQNYAQVHQKRAMGIALAAVVIPHDDNDPSALGRVEI